MDVNDRHQTQGRSYYEGLEMLASMRLCANAPAMLAVRQHWVADRALNLMLPGGRLLNGATWLTRC